jgi:hypothetical protein
MPAFARILIIALALIVVIGGSWASVSYVQEMQKAEMQKAKALEVRLLKAAETELVALDTDVHEETVVEEFDNGDICTNVCSSLPFPKGRTPIEEFCHLMKVNRKYAGNWQSFYLHNANYNEAMKWTCDDLLQGNQEIVVIGMHISVVEVIMKQGSRDLVRFFQYGSASAWGGFLASTRYIVAEQLQKW